MAYVVQLAQAAPILNGNSMTQILNVSQPVGMQYNGAPNLYGDVSAVQGLIAIQAAGNQAIAQPIPTVTGTFDSMTGYYIFDQQVVDRLRFPTSIVDGVVSPAPQSGGLFYQTGGVWTIVGLNVGAANANYDAWQALLATYAANSPGM
jgi:hypothetical protein